MIHKFPEKCPSIFHLEKQVSKKLKKPIENLHWTSFLAVRSKLFYCVLPLSDKHIFERHYNVACKSSSELVSQNIYVLEIWIQLLKYFNYPGWCLKIVTSGSYTAWVYLKIGILEYLDSWNSWILEFNFQVWHHWVSVNRMDLFSKK